MNETKWKRSRKEKASFSEEAALDNGRVRLSKEIPIPSLPSQLPLANMLHRDLMGLLLATKIKNQRPEIKGIYVTQYAYPNQKNIPVPAAGAKILTLS